ISTSVIANCASATSFQTLYSFCSLANCADGQTPLAPLVQDAVGNLYGTTGGGGNSNNGGIVFEATQGTDGNWTIKTIHEFCQQANCTDGADPEDGFIFDVNGNIYGMTAAGGMFGEGTVYKLTPNVKRTKWKLKILHDFCMAINCTDGSLPWG